MPRARSALLLLILALPARALTAQGALREYRPEVVVAMPRWHRVGFVLIGEQHLNMGDLAPLERHQGIGIVSPTFAHGFFGVDFRQVSTNGLVEHRWQPQVTLTNFIGGGIELRDRTRVELRDIAGVWSQRYQNRATMQRSVRVISRATSPYAYYDLSYDTRYGVLNRRECGAGIRIPVTKTLSVDPSVMRQTDTRRAVDALVAVGMTVRLAL